MKNNSFLVGLALLVFTGVACADTNYTVSTPGSVSVTGVTTPLLPLNQGQQAMLINGKLYIPGTIFNQQMNEGIVVDPANSNYIHTTYVCFAKGAKTPDRTDMSCALSDTQDFTSYFAEAHYKAGSKQRKIILDISSTVNVHNNKDKSGEMSQYGNELSN